MHQLFYWAIGGLAAALLVAAVVNWDTIRDWLKQPRSNAAFGKLVKDKLANGDYAVVGGVFDHGGNQIDSNSWRAKSLDPELLRLFGGRDEVVVTL